MGADRPLLPIENSVELAAFGGARPTRNALSLYVYPYHPVLAGRFATDMPPPAWQENVAVHAFQTVALGFPPWMTWD